MYSKKLHTTTTASSSTTATPKSRSLKNLVKYNGGVYEIVETELEAPKPLGPTQSAADYYSSSTWISSPAASSSSLAALNGQSSSSSCHQLGMTVAGYCPCHVEAVAEGSAAWRAGVRRADLIVRVNGVNCCRARLKSVLALVKQASRLPAPIKLTIYRPVNQQQQQQQPSRPINSKFTSDKLIMTTDSHGKTTTTKKPIKSTTMKSTSLKSKLLAKLLLKPSMWLSCAQPNNQTLHQSTFYFAPSSSNAGATTTTTTSSGQVPIYASMIETNLNAAAVPQSTRVNSHHHRDDHSHDEVMKPAGSIILHTNRAGDTGYETLSTRYEAELVPPASTLFQMPIENENSNKLDNDDDDFEVTMTVNSYSGLDDVTLDSDRDIDAAKKKTAQQQQQQQQPPSTSDLHNEPGCESFNEMRTKLIGDLIEMEANFVSYLSMAVATFSRPLRGFFIKQHDYFCLFQNIEKILVISENFLRSMDKWSAYDLYTKIGQLYSHKMALFRDAYTLYARGHHSAKSLLAELRQHSKQFRLFLTEVESSELTLECALDLPVTHVQRTLEIFKRIRGFTFESRRNPAEAPHIDSVIFELRSVLAQLSSTSSTNNNKPTAAVFNENDDETMTSIEYTLSSIEEEQDDDNDSDDDDDEDTTAADFTTITMNARQQRRRRCDDRNSCCSSSSSSSSSCASSEHDDDEFATTTFFLSPIGHH